MDKPNHADQGVPEDGSLSNPKEEGYKHLSLRMVLFAVFLLVFLGTDLSALRTSPFSSDDPFMLFSADMIGKSLSLLARKSAQEAVSGIDGQSGSLESEADREAMKLRIAHVFGAILLIALAALFLFGARSLWIGLGGTVALLLVCHEFGLPFHQHVVESLACVVLLFFFANMLDRCNTGYAPWISALFGIFMGCLVLARQSVDSLILFSFAVCVLVILPVWLFRSKNASGESAMAPDALSRHLKWLRNALLLIAFAYLIFAAFLFFRATQPGTRALIQSTFLPGGIVFLLAGTVSHIIQWLRKSRSYPRWSLHVAVSLLFFAAGFLCLTRVISTYVASRTRRPISSHGAGYPLYGGLGFVENAYNIAWDDDLIDIMGMIDTKYAWSPKSPVHQRGALDRAVLIFAEDPLLLIRNVVAKAKYVFDYWYLRHPPDRIASDWNTPPLSWRLPVLATASLVGLFVGLGLAWKSGDLRSRLLWLLLLSMALAGGVVLLLAAPFYMSVIHGMCLSILFIILPACTGWFRCDPVADPACPVLARHWKRILVVTVVGVVVASGYVLYRVQANAKAAIVFKESVMEERLSAVTPDHVPHFNRLDLEDQRRVLDQMEGWSRARAYEPELTGSMRPVWGWDDGEHVYLVAHLGVDWVPTGPSRQQGTRSSGMMLWAEGEEAPHNYPPLRRLEKPRARGYLKINDHFWTGRYRMFCLPATGLLDVERWKIGHYNFVGGGHYPALDIETLTTGTLYRIDPGGRH